MEAKELELAKFEDAKAAAWESIKEAREVLAMRNEDYRAITALILNLKTGFAVGDVVRYSFYNTWLKTTEEFTGVIKGYAGETDVYGYSINLHNKDGKLGGKYRSITGMHIAYLSKIDVKP